MKKELKQKARNRILIDELFNNMNVFHHRIEVYAKYMDENTFATSEEVENLYQELQKTAFYLYNINK